MIDSKRRGDKKMGKIVLRCSACNSYYDGGIYSHCPYCENETGTAVVTIKETPNDFSSAKNDAKNKESKPSKKAGFWDRFYRKSSAEEQGKTLLSAVVANEKESPDSIEIKEINNESGNYETNNLQKEFPDDNVRHKKTQPLLYSDENREGIDSLHNKTGGSSQTSEQTELRTVGRFIPVSNKTPQSESEIMQDLKEHNYNQNSTSSLTDIRNYGVTQGRYFSNDTNSTVAPVVGWLVCIKGQEIGKSYNLKKGRNRIGRAMDMDVKLLNENSVSRICQAVLIYDSKAREFYLLPGESDSLCYLNDKALYERTALSDRDTIEFGDSGKNRFMFVRFCNQDFDWNMTEE